MTLIEILIVVAIIGTLTAIAIPNFLKALHEAKLNRAMADIRYLESELTDYTLGHEALPDTLAEAVAGNLIDPWGSPYQYLKIRGADPPPRGQWRKDRFLVPINSDYDLYSRGPDGRSRPPLTARHSRDDIIRAADGAFLGIAEEY